MGQAIEWMLSIPKPASASFLQSRCGKLWRSPHWTGPGHGGDRACYPVLVGHLGGGRIKRLVRLQFVRINQLVRMQMLARSGSSVFCLARLFGLPGGEMRFYEIERDR